MDVEKLKKKVRGLSPKSIALRGRMTTSLPPEGINRNTQDGLSNTYSIIAGECLDDAKRLHKVLPDPDTTGKYIITCHALEVSLKAFLVRHGLTEIQLSRAPYGHNLNNLYNSSLKKGLRLRLSGLSPSDVKEAIELFNRYHYEYKEDGLHDEALRYALRYDAGLKVLPSCGVLIDIIEGVLNAVKENPERT